MTQTKLLFGSLLLRKHVNSRQFIAPILNPSWGSNPKPTAQTVHSYLAGRFLNGYLSVQIGKRYDTTHCTALGRNNKTDKNFLSSRSEG